MCLSASNPTPTHPPTNPIRCIKILTDCNYYNTMLPRIPTLVERQIKAYLILVSGGCVCLSVCVGVSVCVPPSLPLTPPHLVVHTQFEEEQRRAADNMPFVSQLKDGTEVCTTERECVCVGVWKVNVGSMTRFSVVVILFSTQAQPKNTHTHTHAHSLSLSLSLTNTPRCGPSMVTRTTTRPGTTPW